MRREFDPPRPHERESLVAQTIQSQCQAARVVFASVLCRATGPSAADPMAATVDGAFAVSAEVALLVTAEQL